MQAPLKEGLHFISIFWSHPWYEYDI